MNCNFKDNQFSAKGNIYSRLPNMTKKKKTSNRIHKDNGNFFFHVSSQSITEIGP